MQNTAWWVAKVFSEHLIQMDKPGFKVYIDPIFDFGYGQELETFNNDEDDLYINTRGFSISGKINGRSLVLSRSLKPIDGFFERIILLISTVILS